jgi:hypothetical protein
MAATPRWKIYNPEGEYVAACKYGEDAACLMAFLGEGATIRDGHSTVVWNEGREACSAGESYDFVANTIISRANGTRSHAEQAANVPGLGENPS